MEKKISKAALIIFLGVLCWLIGAWVLYGKEFVKAEYGVNPQTAVIVAIVAEIFFDLGIIGLLFAGGASKIRFKDIKSFDFKKLNFGNKWSYIFFMMNRLAALAPSSYILLDGNFQLPLVISIALALEIVATLFLWAGLEKWLGIGKDRIKVRRARLDDVDALLALDKKAWGEDVLLATRDMMIGRIETFSEGQIVAELDGKIVGYIGIQLFDLEKMVKKTWIAITDNGSIRKSHNFRGQYLFGVGLTVDPDYRRKGIGDRLMIGAAAVAVKYRVKGGYLGSRIPYYYKFADKMTVEEYVKDRENGKLKDPELSLYEKKGFRVVEIVANYYEDPESLNYGVLMYLENTLSNIPFSLFWAALMKKVGFPLFKLFQKSKS